MTELEKEAVWLSFEWLAEEEEKAPSD